MKSSLVFIIESICILHVYVYIYIFIFVAICGYTTVVNSMVSCMHRIELLNHLVYMKQFKRVQTNDQYKIDLSHSLEMFKTI